MSRSYDDWKSEEPVDPDQCACGNPVKKGYDVCRECLSEIRAEARGERV